MYSNNYEAISDWWDKYKPNFPKYIITKEMLSEEGLCFFISPEWPIPTNKSKEFTRRVGKKDYLMPNILRMLASKNYWEHKDFHKCLNCSDDEAYELAKEPIRITNMLYEEYLFYLYEDLFTDKIYEYSNDERQLNYFGYQFMGLGFTTDENKKIINYPAPIVEDLLMSGRRREVIYEFIYNDKDDLHFGCNYIGGTGYQGENYLGKVLTYLQLYFNRYFKYGQLSREE